MFCRVRTQLTTWCDTIPPAVPFPRSCICLLHSYLINGYKFDIRLYVLCTSFDPLRVYIFEDGLVRFCTMKYSNKLETLSKTYMHLTNVSLNKSSPDFVDNTDANVTNVGSKWTWKSLLAYLIEHEGAERTRKVGVHRCLSRIQAK